MLLEDLYVTPDELARRTGWHLRPEGACKADRCVPLPADITDEEGLVDVSRLAAAMDLPLVGDPEHGVWALGPESGRALTSAEAPHLGLPDLDGTTVELSALKGRKVILVAWASW